MSDLVEQLRLEAKHDTHSARAPKLVAAAERIEFLEAEVERWKLAHEDIYREYGEKCERVGQLREALLRIIERYDDADAGTYDRPLDNAIEGARRDLAGEGDEDG